MHGYGDEFMETSNHAATELTAIGATMALTLKKCRAFSIGGQMVGRARSQKMKNPSQAKKLVE